MRTLRTGLVGLLFCSLAPQAHAQVSRTMDRTFDLAADGTVAIDA